MYTMVDVARRIGRENVSVLSLSRFNLNNEMYAVIE